jgi:hypothetical protein
MKKKLFVQFIISLQPLFAQQHDTALKPTASLLKWLKRIKEYGLLRPKKRFAKPEGKFHNLKHEVYHLHGLKNVRNIFLIFITTFPVFVI